ncbi:MAG: tRNA 2-thiouridine(34) synthase MnmA [Candidatus Shikimatogenerans sp. Ttur]|uniref:tRNA-uridine 2-sulfurtransferase n=1 Tax=Candidatus Shikimatogenerans sp. Ttur TaxID=3158569 RepID=A0AAU7ZY06_9FLAO
MKKVITLLSGGVDSTVANILIKKKYKLIACVFIKILDNCISNEDEKISLLISNLFKVPFYSIFLKKEYNKYVLKYFKKQYVKGYTPNPDIICNYKIKFNFLLKKIKFLNYDFIITGHYSIIKKIKNKYRLYEGKDKKKDQSYFLSKLTQKQLSILKFPLGRYKKKKIRSIAKKYNLINYKKKSSKGICFLGKNLVNKILNLKKKKGIIYKLYCNKNKYIKYIKYNLNKKNIKKINYNNINYNLFFKKKIGYHDGYSGFTRGQRRGLKIGGYKHALYIIDFNIINNIIYVAENIKHRLLYNNSLFIKKIFFINKEFEKKNNKNFFLKIKIRYRDKQKLQYCFLIKNYNNGYIIYFFKKQFCICKGQFIVFYKNNEVLGSAVINKYNNLKIINKNNK